MTEPSDSPPDPVRVVIVDDDQRYAEALAELVGLSEHFDVVGVANGVDDGCDLLRRTGAEFGLIDVNMDGGGGVSVVRQMVDWPSRPLLVLISAQSPDPDVADQDAPFLPKDQLDIARLWSMWLEMRC
ncbi:MAG: response regulator [Acidimicrobiales bacterium]